MRKMFETLHWGLFLLALVSFGGWFWGVIQQRPSVVVAHRCADYPGQRVVSSRITLATGEVACVYAPEQPRR